MQLKFVKNTTTGNVQIVSVTQPERFASLSPAASVVMNPNKTAFSIFGVQGEKQFTYSDVVAYQIDSNPEVSTTGLPLIDFLKVLSTSFFFEVTGGGEVPAAFVRTGEASANIVATPTHNLVITGIEEVSIIRLTAALNCIVTGFDASTITEQQYFTVINESTSQSIQFPKENINSSANNRFTMTGTSRTIAAGACAEMMYDLSINRFRILN